MFADKLQNPFLKSSPFSLPTTTYTSSYTSALPPPSRYGSYKTYQQPRISQLNSVNRTVAYESSLPTYTSRIHQTKDIDVMLSNNPFNRQFYPSFAQSRQYGDVSPSKYSNEVLVTGRSSVTSNNFDSYAPLQKYNDIGRPLNINTGSRGLYGESQSRLTPPKKYDNYLSTSSAESAATYINKIYDLDDDRGSVNEGKPLGSNPFYRKNLLQRTVDKQVSIPTNDYDAAVLKYAGYKMEERRQPVEFEQKDRVLDYVYKPLKEDNTYRGSSFGNEKQMNYEPYAMKYENTFSNDHKIDQKDYQTSKFVEEDYRIDAQKYAFKESDSREYEQYDAKRESYGTYKSPYNFQEQVPKKNDSSKYLSNKYDRPQSKKEFDLDRLDYRTQTRPKEYDYTYNSKQNLPYEQEQQKMRFSQNSETDSPKFMNNKNPIEQIIKKNPFAGGPKDFSKGSKSNFEKELQQPLKLASSQVDEYTGPEEIERKIKENKYQQLGIKREIERPDPSYQQMKKIESYEDAYGSGPLKSRGAPPIRDSSEQFPKTLQINGTMFHRVELECR